MDMDVTRKVWEMEEISITGYSCCCDGWKVEFGTRFEFKRGAAGLMLAVKGLVSPVTGKPMRPLACCPFCGERITIKVKEPEPAGPGVEEAAAA